jgi:hypothetical protein
MCIVDDELEEERAAICVLSDDIEAEPPAICIVDEGCEEEQPAAAIPPDARIALAPTIAIIRRASRLDPVKPPVVTILRILSDCQDFRHRTRSFRLEIVAQDSPGYRRRPGPITAFRSYASEGEMSRTVHSTQALPAWHPIRLKTQTGSRSGQTRREAGTQSQGSHADRPAADLTTRRVSRDIGGPEKCRT